jgi:hypothetical protein
MAGVVTSAGSVTCNHGGKAPLSSTAKLTVADEPVLPFSAVATLGPYAKCQFTVSGNPKPCTTTTATAPNPGQAGKLTVGGAAVLLDALVATTDNPPTNLPLENPPSTVTAAAGQTKLTAQ